MISWKTDVAFSKLWIYYEASNERRELEHQLVTSFIFIIYLSGVIREKHVKNTPDDQKIPR